MKVGPEAFAVSSSRENKTKVLIGLQCPNTVRMYDYGAYAALLADTPQLYRPIATSTNTLNGDGEDFGDEKDDGYLGAFTVYGDCANIVGMSPQFYDFLTGPGVP